MKLQISKRSTEKKREAKRIRREGRIPAVLYVRNNAGENITVNEAEFQALLRKVPPGRLSTTQFTLVDEGGKERQAIIKDIQYHVTTYNVSHLDFEELIPKQAVNVKVPIECFGAELSPGVKLGGQLRQVIRYVKVRCLPKDIPTHFELGVKELGPRQSKRLSDLAMPQAIRPLADLKEVVAVVVKR